MLQQHKIVAALFNNLALNTNKTKEMASDYRRHTADSTQLDFYRDSVIRVPSFKFLETYIAEPLSGCANNSSGG